MQQKQRPETVLVLVGKVSLDVLGQNQCAVAQQPARRDRNQTVFY